MRRYAWTFRSMLGLAVVVVCLLGPSALAGPNDEPGEKKISIGKVPSKAKAAILKAVGNGKIRDVGEFTANGKVVRYEVEYHKGGQEFDVVVSPDGKVLENREEPNADEKPAAQEKPVAEEGNGDGGEKKISIDKVPSKAKAAILKAVGNGKIRDVGEFTANGKVVRYEVEYHKGGQEFDVVVSPDGKVLENREEPNADEKAPAKVGDAEAAAAAAADAMFAKFPEAVRKTVLKEAGKHSIREVEEKNYDGKKLYESSWIDGDDEVEIQVTPEGQVAGRKVEKGGAAKAKAEIAAKFGQAAKPADDKGWQSTFKVDKKNLVSVGRNPYFVLIPGYKLHLSGGGETVVVGVLNKTKVVDGVECRVVEEYETADGKLSEISRNYFAIDKTTNDVYYFGEDVDIYDEAGKITGHSGAWLSGEKGARFGLFLPGGPRVGQRFYQETAPNVAMDRAEIVELDATLKTPLKTFTHCLRIRETSPLESGTSHKWFVAGIGLVGDDEMRLTKVEEPAGKK